MEYKIIFLQKGLEKLSEYQFRKVKCILAEALRVTANVQEDYDRIQVTNRMFATFSGPECVSKLIEAINSDSELSGLAKSLQEQMQQVSRRLRAGGAAAPKRRKQMGTTGPSAPACSSSGPGTSQRVGEDPVAQKRKKCTQEPSNSQGSTAPCAPTQCPLLARAQPCASQDPSPAAFSPDLTAAASAQAPQNTRPQEPLRKEPSSHILQEGPILVKVLQVGKTFETTTLSGEKRFLLHAVVATTTEFFPVKVFDRQLKDRFICRKVLHISQYVKANGFLEVTEESSVTETAQQLSVPQSPRIAKLSKLAPGAVLSGCFTLAKKTTQKTNTVYEIKDKEKSMAVVGRGRCHNVACQEGDQLWLFGFRLRTQNQEKILCSKEDSYIQVIERRHSQGSTIPERSATNMTSEMPQTPQMPQSSDGQTESVSRLVDTFQEQGQQAQRKVVVVLSVTEPFCYHKDRRMFHATVALKDETQSQIIHVKVFHEGFRTEFALGNIVALSNYIGRNGFLEVYKNTSVKMMGTIKVPTWIISTVTETLKISELRQQAPHTTVNGVFLVKQKVERSPCVYYEIQDDTGTMEVMVFGHLTRVPCEVGDRIQLICFELGENQDQLRSLIHSFLKVV